MRRKAADSEERQLPFEKSFFGLNGGLNTEASPLLMPNGSSLDESDFEILRDGTRRRRKGIAAETGGTAYTLPVTNTLTAASRMNSFQWENVDTDSSLTMQVIKVGGQLHFYKDQETLSAAGNKLAGLVDIGEYATTDVYTDITDYEVTFAANQGHLFVAGRYLNPLRITYNKTSGVFEVYPIELRIRDFYGIDDKVNKYTKPETLTPQHKYNLLNRGWLQLNIDTYAAFFVTAKYPAKNMIPWLGYTRKSEAGKTAGNTEYDSRDWTKTYSSAKIEAEVFGNADAPQGRFLLNPFDTTYGLLGPDTNNIPATVVTANNGPGNTWAIAITTATAHGLGAGVAFIVSGGKFIVKSDTGVVQGAVIIDGTWVTATILSATVLTFNVKVPYAWRNFWANSTFVGPSTLIKEKYPRSTGYVTNERPTAIAFFAGRTWFAGINHPSLSDVVLFSQIVPSPEAGEELYGYCYQKYDPTSELLSMLLPDDGGTIQVPGLAGVLAMKDMGNGVMILSKTGIYQIAGGDQYFSANNYEVGKVTDIEALSAAGVLATDSGLVFTSPRGIYIITADSQTGRVGPQSLILETIQTRWNSIPDSSQTTAMLTYDSALKKIYVAYQGNTALPAIYYTTLLVFDERNTAWAPYSVPYALSGLGAVYIAGMLSIEAGDNSNRNKKIKFVVISAGPSSTDMILCDMDHTTFTDFTGTQAIPFISLAYDGIGSEGEANFSRQRQAMYVYTYMRRTETETDPGNEYWNNPSGLFIEGRWNFADGTISGKITRPQQVYAPTRLFVDGPIGNGLPIVVTKRKIRGRGQTLNIKYTGEADRDAHLIGYTAVYNIDRNM